MSWVQKYRPKTLDEFAGQNKQIKKLRNWYKNWKSGDKPLILHGPPGSGKTTAVHALANEEDLDLLEVNASDTRNKDSINQVIGSASQQMSLTGRKRLILIDEVDGTSGNSDRGGISALMKLIKKSKFPIVMTANDPYDSKLRYLRKKCEMVDFGKVHLSSMTAFLNKICENEGIEAERKVLKQICRQTSGDLRSAINDLETLAKGNDKIVMDDLETLGYREKKEDIFQGLKVIFKTTTAKNAKQMINRLDEDPDEIFWWIEENVPREYKNKEDMKKAFDMLSKANLFRSRISRRQNWSLMKYMIGLMSAGVALSKEDRYSGFTRYRPPNRLKIYGRTKGKRKRLDELCDKLQPHLHVSHSKIKTEYFPLFKKLIEENENFEKVLEDKFDLEEKEIEEITNF